MFPFRATGHGRVSNHEWRRSRVCPCDQHPGWRILFYPKIGILRSAGEGAHYNRTGAIFHGPKLPAGIILARTALSLYKGEERKEIA